ncbi:MAG: aspartate aminotransferase family protein [Pseudomonadota bacterium]
MAADGSREPSPNSPSHVFPRHMRTNLPTVASGNGVYLTDKTGKTYLDGSSGAAVSSIGHGDPDVIAAIKAQLDDIAFAHTGFFTSEPAEQLASVLSDRAPGDLEHVYFVSGGSEAVEAALKLARQYHLENGQPQRTKLIARKRSYHGNTLGALAAGGSPWRRAQFEPLLIDVAHIDPPFAYRLQDEGEDDEAFALRMADKLEEELQRLGPETVIAFIAETVGGATAGAIHGPPSYLQRIREICDRHGVLLILDEVMCGMGRTGHLFACQEDGVVPDIVCIAKGLGGGYQPIGAMICRDHVYQTIEQGTGFFQHGHTYIGHPTACAAGLAVMGKMTGSSTGETGGLVARCHAQGEKLTAALRERFGQHAHVGDIRGRGLFRALEFVADRETKQPFPAEKAVAATLKKAALEAGLICYPMPGTIDGKRGDHVLLAPPFIITDAQIGELVDKLAIAVDKATA